MAVNKNLHKAKREKNDEFYTQLIDIEKELEHYKEHLKGKIIYCNCDKQESKFNTYFSTNFERLQIKKLLISDGDFRNEECIELLKQSDIVVTNPPFSLFRKYVAQLMEYEKKFLILGPINAITYKEIFPVIKENKMWLGPSIYSGDREFQIPESVVNLDQVSTIRIGKNGKKIYITKAIVRWYTNLSHKKRNEELILVQNYKGSENDYPKYDNYDAIEVSRVKNIPKDYNGAMGVPISFLDKHNPNQFEILGQMANTKIDAFNFGYPFVNKKRKYARIIIKRK